MSSASRAWIVAASIGADGIMFSDSGDRSAGEAARVCNRWNVVKEEERVLSCCVQVREEKIGKKRKRKNKKESVQAGGGAGEGEEEEERHGGWRCRWGWVCSKEGHAGRRRERAMQVGG
ncbi:hypothetical protein AAC387_Pa05g1927 [Persea americana]